MRRNIWETGSHSAVQEILHFSWNQEVHWSVHMSQFIPIRIHVRYFFKNRINIDIFIKLLKHKIAFYGGRKQHWVFRS